MVAKGSPSCPSCRCKEYWRGRLDDTCKCMMVAKGSPSCPSCRCKEYWKGRLDGTCKCMMVAKGSPSCPSCRYKEYRKGRLDGTCKCMMVAKGSPSCPSCCYKEYRKGDFENLKPPKAQLDAAKLFLNYSVNSGQLYSNYNLIGHKQVAKTQSPGRQLFKIIKTWEHWERCNYMC
uniref:Uncharacterized protein n=1 Tax=Timema tahoe TaxID=61484 RepID=A0A7R9NZR3_9NEOP|nr:unnamed protein product [Timema tahoe]